MAGRLTIYSTGDGRLRSGHSWIAYERDDGYKATFGTWGNNPRGLGNGLHRDLETDRSADAKRSVDIDDEQEARLFGTIEEYERRGDAGWRLFWPCSAFAADAWQAATGEKLEHRNALLISNPSTLKASIETG
jgi:hypothetical protein